MGAVQDPYAQHPIVLARTYCAFRCKAHLRGIFRISFLFYWDVPKIFSNLLGQVGRALDSLGERRQTDLRRNSGQGTVPHEDRIKSVFKLLYNNMLGDGEKSYVLSFCQPSGSGTAASVAELADLTADEWEAAYLRTLHNRPGGCYSEDDVIASMLALATALQVTIDVGTLDQSNPRLEKVLTRAMHARGLEEIHREDKRRGRARSMSEQEAWEKLCAEIGFGVPTIRDVTEAVQELCGSVLWHLEGTEVMIR